MSQRCLVKKFNLSLSSINKIIKARDEYIELRDILSNKNIERKQKFTKTENFDNILYKWIQSKRRINMILTNSHIKNMEILLANKIGIGEFSASDCWLGNLRNDTI
ncbi:Tigger transposable element-derived protein 6 [Dictyocoela muelleri]|nr:Tigger transposable element-derived protein 6 [Dictyocoela muelleri]